MVVEGRGGGFGGGGIVSLSEMKLDQKPQETNHRGEKGAENVNRADLNADNLTR
jgi:hypothetical protein